MKTDREIIGFPEGFFELDPDINFGNQPTFLSPDDPITRATFIRINPPGLKMENLVQHVAPVRTTIRAAIEHILAREFERTDPNISPVIGIVAGYFITKPVPSDTLCYLRVDAEVRGVRRLSKPRNIPHKTEPPKPRRRREKSAIPTTSATARQKPAVVDNISLIREAAARAKERRVETSPPDRISLIRAAARKAAVAREK